MQSTQTPFRPTWGTTIQLPATVASSRVAIPTDGKPCNAIRIVHTVGTDGVRFRSGNSTVNAVTLTDPLIRATATQPQYFGINAADTHIAVITDSGTGTIEVTFGTGGT